MAKPVSTPQIRLVHEITNGQWRMVESMIIRGRIDEVYSFSVNKE